MTLSGLFTLQNLEEVEEKKNLLEIHLHLPESRQGPKQVNKQTAIELSQQMVILFVHTCRL